MQKKIRNAQTQKVPFMLIAGDDDVEAGAVSFRYRDGTQKQRRAGRRGDRRDRLGGPRPRRGDQRRDSGLAGTPDGVRAALDAAPDATRGETPVPVLRRPGRSTTRQPDRGTAARSATSCSTCTRTTRAPARLPVPARRRLHRPDADETAELAAFTQRAMTVLREVSGPHGLQPRHEPGRRGRRRDRRAPAPARRTALGRDSNFMPIVAQPLPHQRATAAAACWCSTSSATSGPR
jgi:hypothetical protein